MKFFKRIDISHQKCTLGLVIAAVVFVVGMEVGAPVDLSLIFGCLVLAGWLALGPMHVTNGAILMSILLAVLGFLVIYPIFMILFGSFKGGPPGVSSPFSLQGYVTAFTDKDTFTTLFTTFWLAAVRAVLATGLACFLAWVVVRTDTPWRSGLETLIWLKFFLPSLPFTMSWILLAAPNIGLLNRAFTYVTGSSTNIFDVYSYAGISWVSVLGWSAILFILIAPAFRGMDASLEESSRMCGASTLTTIRRVTLPVLMPTILGGLMLAFIRFMEGFETELLLGFGKGIYVYTTRVYLLFNTVPTDYPQAMALTTMFLLLLAVVIVFQWLMLSRKGGAAYVTVTGKGFATRPTKLGKWKWVTFGLVMLYFSAAVVIPLLTMIMGSFMKLFGVFMEDPFTLKQWSMLFSDPRMYSSLQNTLVIGMVAATGGMILYSFISYIICRTNYAGRRILDLVAWLPWGVPGLVLAIGFLWAYVGGLKLPFVLYQTIYLLMLVFIVRGLPMGVTTMKGAMMQIDKSLEESSQMLGASWLHTFRRVIAPLVTPSFVGAWIITFALVVKDLVTVVLLYGPSSRTLSVLTFEYWMGNQTERSIAAGLMLTAITLGLALLARFIARKTTISTF